MTKASETGEIEKVFMHTVILSGTDVGSCMEKKDIYVSENNMGNLKVIRYFLGVCLFWFPMIICTCLLCLPHLVWLLKRYCLIFSFYKISRKYLLRFRSLRPKEINLKLNWKRSLSSFPVYEFETWWFIFCKLMMWYHSSSVASLIDSNKQPGYDMVTFLLSFSSSPF